MFLKLAVTKCVLIPETLERKRFLQAAHRVLQSFPEIGSRYTSSLHTVSLSWLQNKQAWPVNMLSCCQLNQQTSSIANSAEGISW